MSERESKYASEEELLKQSMEFFDQPLEWAMWAFDWMGDPDLQLVRLPDQYRDRFPGLEWGPDEWFCEFLDDLGEEIRKNGFDFKNAVMPVRMARSSGHGIGKSFGTGILINFVMSTRPHSKGVVTANTSDQLKTKTWGEFVKLKKKCITGHLFEHNTGRANMNVFHKQHPETWRVDAQTCKEENSESFAGLHCANSTPWYLFDEASAVPDKIWEVAEGGTTDGEPFWFVFGNPTRNTGRFRECWRRFRHLWNAKQIDSRSCQITNKKLIKTWEETYGADSDFFKIRVKGMFPSASSKQLIPEKYVNQAMARHARKESYETLPLALSCDPAWDGDDELVIGYRQGLYFEILERIPKNDDDVYIAGLLNRYANELDADHVFIDMGYGTGIFSVFKHMNKTPVTLVAFGSKSTRPDCYNLRAAIWKETLEWLKQGGILPDEEDLLTDLTSPETIPRLDGLIQLMSKEDIKKLGLPSPNMADCLAMTFTHPINKKAIASPVPKAGQKAGSYGSGGVTSSWKPLD